MASLVIAATRYHAWRTIEGYLNQHNKFPTNSEKHPPKKVRVRLAEDPDHGNFGSENHLTSLED